MITFTDPILISKNPHKYQYTLSGLINSTNTVFVKTKQAAIQHAKNIINSYVNRCEISFNRSKTTQEERKLSKWTGVIWCKEKCRWRVSVTPEAGRTYIGSYKTLVSAIAAKKKHNEIHGLDKYHGFK